MARGGTRPGAGRKAGAPNKATAERQAEIEASGLTPLEFMLDVLRDTTQSMENRCWAADKAAPFVHPKLAAVSLEGTMTHEAGDTVRALMDAVNGLTRSK